MDNAIKPKHARWAAQHDWFIRSYQQVGHTITVVVREYEDDDATKPVEREFSGLDELREWAGY